MVMKNEINVAIIQMEVKSDIFGTDVRKINVNKALKLIENVCKENNELDLVVLPEEFYAGAGYGPISLPDTYGYFENEYLAEIQELSRKYNVIIIGALSLKKSEEDFRSDNVGFVVDKQGSLLGYQNRFHKNIQEAPYTNSGEKFHVFDLDIGKVSLVIGNDILYPEISRKFVLKGAELLINPILLPGNTEDKDSYPKNIYQISSTCRAIENQAYVITVNGVGEFAHIDMNICGESVISSPTGVLNVCDNTEQTKIFKITIDDYIESNRVNPIMRMRNKKVCSIDEGYGDDV
jgi:hypothetical protein